MVTRFDNEASYSHPISALSFPRPTGAKRSFPTKQSALIATSVGLTLFGYSGIFAYSSAHLKNTAFNPLRNNENACNLSWRLSATANQHLLQCDNPRILSAGDIEVHPPIYLKIRESFHPIHALSFLYIGHLFPEEPQARLGCATLIFYDDNHSFGLSLSISLWSSSNHCCCCFYTGCFHDPPCGYKGAFRCHLMLTICLIFI